MATRAMEVTSTPTALAGTAAGTRYAVQNTGETPIRVATATSAPTRAVTAAFVLQKWTFHYPEPAAGEMIFVWTADARLTGSVAFEESA